MVRQHQFHPECQGKRAAILLFPYSQKDQIPKMKLQAAKKEQDLSSTSA